MGDNLEYPDVLQEVRGVMNPGRLKLQSTSVMFRNIKTGRVDQFNSSDIEQANWLIRARGYCLKLICNNGNIYRYDGFRDSEYDKLSSFISKNYNTDLKKKDVSLKGWNWGAAEFAGNSLDFVVGGSSAFEIPLSNVSQTMTAKNEVTIEFHQNDDAAVSLMEVRFHIPTDPNLEVDAVQDFHSKVMVKADIIQATGDAIAIFSEVQCLTPRGRYDFKIYPTFLQLHGKTFDYKIPYTTILRLFLLPHRDNRQMFFVVSLDPPIKQGQTRYHFLILLFNKEDEITLELGLSEEDLLEKYEGKLTKEMSGPEYEIISRMMKTLVNRKITVPGTFLGHSGTHSVACSYKAATGFLYPLERGFIFVHKPPLHIRFDEIGCVNFGRSAGTTRSFDFDVETNANTTFNFVGIEKEEYGKLYDFVKNKKLRVKNIGNKIDKPYNDDMMQSDDEDEHDAYLQRVKKEGRRRDDDDDEDDDSADDEDFDPFANEVSEPDDEWDSNVSSTDSEASAGSGSSGDDEAKKKRREKRKSEKENKTKVKTVREPGTRKKRSKKDKDPTRPKRPQSAYFLWLNEHREQIKEENPGIGITDVSKKAGEMWRQVTDKTEWEKKAVVEKEAYEVRIAKWKEEQAENPTSPATMAASPKKKKKKKAADTTSPVKETSSGAGGNFKSKEFILDSESASPATSDDDEPLQKKKKKEEKAEASEEEKQSSEADSEADDSD